MFVNVGEFLGKVKTVKPNNLKPLKIFVIDDDAFFIKTAKEYFSTYMAGNYEFHYYSSGEQAILESYKNPSLVIVDYYLDSNEPDADNGLRVINGFHVLLPKTKLILVSKNPTDKLFRISAELGYFECMEKNTLFFDVIKQKLDNLTLPVEMGLLERLKTYFAVVSS